jgi:hypothetical protein
VSKERDNSVVIFILFVEESVLAKDRTHRARGNEAKNGILRALASLFSLDITTTGIRATLFGTSHEYGIPRRTTAQNRAAYMLASFRNSHEQRHERRENGHNHARVLKSA